jgi:hypothetical protein
MSEDDGWSWGIWEDGEEIDEEDENKMNRIKDGVMKKSLKKKESWIQSLFRQKSQR